MKDTIRTLLLITSVGCFQCNSQTKTNINPSLEVKFVLGDRDFFEKDLKYIKSIRDNEMITVNNYSFLPKMLYRVNDQVILFDRFSGNLLAYNHETKSLKNIHKISATLKKAIDYKRQNIELVDVSGDTLFFFNNSVNEGILFSLSDKLEECLIGASNPIAIEQGNDTLRLFSYEYAYSVVNCDLYSETKNKRIPINENNSFIKAEHILYYQTLDNGRIQYINVNAIPLERHFIKLEEEPLSINFNLIHVDEKYYVLASNIEEGLGEFLFIDKKELRLKKRVKINESILTNSLIDFNDLTLDVPSPDVDDPNSYLRMTSIDDKYFILFQSKGVVYLYSFKV